MVYTGGQLNWLNGQSKVSNPNESVHVMSLINEHDPKSHEELEQLISDHVGGADCCDVESGGTVEDFGRWLYEAQDAHWGEKRFTLEECQQWEYDLFVVQSLKGKSMEDKAIEILDDRVGPASFERAGQLVDEDYRIDIEVLVEGDLVAGIQVKPYSYKKARESVQYRNDIANEEYEVEALYLYYDYDTEEFNNMESVVADVSATTFARIHKL